jgi:hypothetical protein
MHNAGADVGAADVDGENRVVRLEDPGRREVKRTKESGLIGVMANDVDLDLDLLGL